MIDGAALASRAIGDVARRGLAVEWGGPEPAAAQVAVAMKHEPARRVTMRKP